MTFYILFLPGALFFKDEEAIELSFDEAFRELNNMKLFELKFVTIKRYVPYDDSFVLQQLSKYKILMKNLINLIKNLKPHFSKFHSNCNFTM